MKHRVAMALAALAACASSCCSGEARDLDACRKQIEGLRRLAEECDHGLRTETSARQLAEKRLTAYRNIVQKLTNVRWGFDPGELSFDIRRGQLVVELPHKVLFEPGETELMPRGKQALRQVASILKTLEGRRFLVAGHTDNVPVAKKNPRFKSNWELAAQRAIAVVAFLQKEGVDPKQLGVAAFGPHQPIATNSTERGRARNRRIEVLILPTVEEIVPLPDEIGGDPPQSK